jgi:Zn-dependent protease with chaperone function
VIENPYLPAVLAHELGHIATFDGRLTAALNRLLIHPPPRPPAQPKDNNDTTQTKAVLMASDRVALGITLFGLLAWTIRKIIRFAKGGLGLRLTAPAWGAYWREREYTADQYAAQLGQVEDLADFLETHALIHDHPVPFIWLTEHSHPPTELRIDKLRNPRTNPGNLRELPSAA